MLLEETEQDEERKGEHMWMRNWDDNWEWMYSPYYDPSHDNLPNWVPWAMAVGIIAIVALSILL